jgi:hypothetical protein
MQSMSTKIQIHLWLMDVPSNVTFLQYMDVALRVDVTDMSLTCKLFDS